jgi:hypothetical protein
MSTDTVASPAPPELQFDRAVFDQETPAPLACRLCQTPIADTYFDVNGQPTCPSCHGELVASIGVDRGFRGLLLAVAAGLGGGLGGALIYYAVLAVTGYEIGLIAILVGLMVGHSVKWGAGGRGGRRFQAIAVAITYVAIVSTYVPFVIAGMQEAPAPTQASASPASDSTTAAPVIAPAGQAGTPAGPQSDTAPTLGEFAIALALMIGVLLALPFLGGLENAIGVLIIGFALWEAWKVNRRATLEVSGPFTVTTVPPSPSAVP